MCDYISPPRNVITLRARESPSVLREIPPDIRTGIHRLHLDGTLRALRSRILDTGSFRVSYMGETETRRIRSFRARAANDPA